MEPILIMSLRQVKQFYRSKPRVFGSVAQPILFLVALGLGIGPVFERAGGMNYIQFLVPGIVGMSLLFSSMLNGMSLIWDKRFGFLKETLVAPVPRFKLLIGRCLGGAIISILQGMIVLLAGLLLGYRLGQPLLFPLLIAVMLLISLNFSLLGTVIASRLEDMEAFPMIMNFLMMPMFFLSGALFPLENLPRAVAMVTTVNPMTYCVNLLKGMMNASFTAANFLDLGILLSLIALLLLIGSIFFEKIET